MTEFRLAFLLFATFAAVAAFAAAGLGAIPFLAAVLLALPIPPLRRYARRRGMIEPTLMWYLVLLPAVLWGSLAVAWAGAMI